MSNMEEIKKENISLNEMQEICENKAESLSKQYNARVIPVILRDEENEGGWVVGYMKEPNRITKLRMLDKSMQGMITAAAELFEAVLLKDVSDARLYSDMAQHDKYYIGASLAANNFVQTSVDQFKKK